MTYKTIGIVIASILAVLLIWGLVGASQAEDIGVTCNAGVGDTLCFSWEQNTIGDVQEFFDDVSDQTGS